MKQFLLLHVLPKLSGLLFFLGANVIPPEDMALLECGQVEEAFRVETGRVDSITRLVDCVEMAPLPAPVLGNSYSLSALVESKKSSFALFTASLLRLLISSTFSVMRIRSPMARPEDFNSSTMAR